MDPISLAYVLVLLGFKPLTLKNDNKPADRSIDQIRNYSFRIGERFYKRLFKHIQFLKQLDSIQHKQEWIEKAISAKLRKEEEQDLDECIPPENILALKLTFKLMPK